MTGITLKQLRYFQALVRHGHFGRAAEASAISQPALSMQIKDLEDTLGATLFERTARRVRPTATGLELEARVRAILQAVDELGDLARVAKGGLSGQLRLGLIPTIAPYLLPALIARLEASHAGLDIRVRETVTAKLIDEVTDGRLDIAIVALPVSEPGLTEIALFEEDFVLVRHAEDADQPVPSARMLREMRLLLLEEGHCFRDQALSFCEIPSARPREGLDGSSLSTLVQMVGARMGVTLIPAMAVPVETRAAPVAVSRLGPPRPTRTVGMVWRRTSPLAAQFLAMGDVIRNAAAG